MSLAVTELDKAVLLVQEDPVGGGGVITATPGTPSTYNIINFDNVTIDTREAWNNTIGEFRTKEGEMYKVSLAIPISSVSTFTGSANDNVLTVYVTLFDLEQQEDDLGTTGPLIPFGTTSAYTVKYNATSLLQDHVITIDTIIPGYKNRTIRVKAYKENCTSVALGVAGKFLSITQI